MTVIPNRNRYAGQKFHFLTVLNAEVKVVQHSGGSKSYYVPVSCDCGVEKFVQISGLKAGDTISCGCSLGKEHRKEVCKEINKTHGGSRTKTYSIWKGMRKRCLNENEESYRHYGGRGVVICPQWDNFYQFLQDMGECPDGYSIERIDVNGNYEPSNCKWIPRNEQPLNRTYNKTVVVGGVAMLFCHALESIGVKKATGSNYRIAHRMTHQEAVDHYLAANAPRS